MDTNIETKQVEAGKWAITFTARIYPEDRAAFAHAVGVMGALALGGPPPPSDASRCAGCWRLLAECACRGTEGPPGQGAHVATPVSDGMKVDGSALVPESTPAGETRVQFLERTLAESRKTSNKLATQLDEAVADLSRLAADRDAALAAKMAAR